MFNKIQPLHNRSQLDSGRNQNFDSFVDSMKQLATKNDINWSIPLDHKGVALPNYAWDLRRIANDGRPKTAVLRTFSLSSYGLEDMYYAQDRRVKRRAEGPISDEWQDFLKALVLEYIIVRKKSLPFIAAASTAIRYLAAVADKNPWQITADDVQLTCDFADIRQPSKGTSIVLKGIMTTVVDRLHLSDACPLMSIVKRTGLSRNPQSKLALAQDKLAKSLAERKSEERLPEQRAFWELVRIVFTETPKTLSDAIRFALVKILLFCGIRIGEATLLPLDWKRSQTYMDNKGRLAGESGGISEVLMMRHFAEKQGTQHLYETTQFVPEIFREYLEQTLDQVAVMTAPLRATLKAQFETGRLFPMYEPHHLVDALEMYVRLTGNPVWSTNTPNAALSCIEQYRKYWDPSDLMPLAGLLNTNAPVTAAVSRYFSQENRSLGLILRNSDGIPDASKGVRGKFLLISDAENYVRTSVKSKLPDLAEFTLDNGSKLAPWEMLFLFPKRAVGAGRGDTILDPNMTFSVGVADQVLLHTSLGDVNSAAQSLFNIYGQTKEDRTLKLKSHSFRHLQNSELFRLGIADTIITKRFNRRTVTQSYEYDHRSLAEDMEELELPDAWSEFLGDSKATTVAKLALAGRAEGPIVREFRRILDEESDEAALTFLAVEADGFHATPYGYCLNSFTVDPCPKHLECFTGCRHLSATNLPENRRNIIELHGRMKAALDAAQARPVSTIGRDNQIAHAIERVKGLEALLATEEGKPVFPDGRDLSKPQARRSVLSGT